MCKRVDNVLNFQGRDNRDTFATNFLEGPDECVFAFDIVPHIKQPTLPNEPDNFEEVQVLQAQIESLCEAQILAIQKKLKFDGVEIPARTGPPRRNAAIPPPPSCGNQWMRKKPGKGVTC